MQKILQIPIGKMKARKCASLRNNTNAILMISLAFASCLLRDNLICLKYDARLRPSSLTLDTPSD